MLSVYSIDQSVKYWVALEMMLSSDVWRCHGYKTDHSFLPWKSGRVFYSSKACTYLENGDTVIVNEACGTDMFFLCEGPPCPEGMYNI